MSGIRFSSAVVHAEQSTVTCLLHQAMRPIFDIYYCVVEVETQKHRELEKQEFTVFDCDDQPMVIRVRRFCRLTTVGQCFFFFSLIILKVKCFTCFQMFIFHLGL